MGITCIDRFNILISRIWDDIVLKRANDIEEKSDYTYHHVIIPWVTDKIIEYTNNKSMILDIGCGCGYLTEHIYQQGRTNIIGMDISKISIEYARKKYPYISFKEEDFYKIDDKNHYDLCLGNMLVNNIPDIKLYFETVARILKHDGILILTIPHPCFWPERHICNQNYNYMQESYFRLPFATKGCHTYRTNVVYFHRPIERYLEECEEAGLSLLDYHEMTEITTDSKPDLLGLVLLKRNGRKL